MNTKSTEAIYVRPAEPKDGSAVWQLIKDAGTLDLNSPYCYIMLCDIFRDTCAVAYSGEELAGFISSYRRPDQPDTLFVWQVAVHSSARGRGVAKAMLKDLLYREQQKSIKYVEATIGPDNIPSRKLFTGLAAERGAECKIVEQYGPNLFPSEAGHEPELMFRVGPLREKKETK